MPYLTIRHRVKDYDAWKTQFDATERPGRLRAAKRVLFRREILGA